MKLNVFFDKEIGVWSSPNAPSLISPIPAFTDAPPADKSHTSLRNVHWLSAFYPYLAFWPFDPAWTGPIFGRLNMSYYTTPLEFTEASQNLYGVRYKHRIAERVANSWERLEMALVGLVKFLLLQRGAAFPHFRFMTLPIECGYKEWHSSEHQARACVSRTQYCFLTLATACSFAIALNMVNDLPGHEPAWVAACKQRGICPVWLARLQETFVCDFSPGFRSGAYVDGWTTPWAIIFHAFNTTCTPLFIIWGHKSLKPKDPAMKPHVPTPEEVREARQWASRPTLPNGLSTSSGPPMPHQGSLQRRGETHEDFVTRMLQDEADYAATEEEAERQSRTEREKQAAMDVADTKLVEPSVGTAMFEWIHHRGGYMLRTQVPRAEWKSKWRLVPAWSKRYYGVLDEWDLEPMPGLEAPSALFADIPLEEEEQPAVVDESPSVPADSPMDLSDFVLPQETFNQDLQITYCNLVALAQLTFDAVVKLSDVQPLPLMHALHYRYGFLAQIPYNTHPQLLPQGTALTPAQIERSAVTLAVRHAERAGLEQAVADFYTFVSSHGNAPVAFGPLWDFDPALLQTFLSHPRFHYLRVHSSLHLIGVKGTPLRKQWYLIALSSATTVVQIFRTQPPLQTHGDITRMLIENGIPFSTVKCLKKAPKGNNERVSVGLGRRGALDVKPGVMEYLAYEEAKLDLLNSSVGRVAVMKGGIVWRLSKDVVKRGVVLKGPSSLSRTDGFVVGTLEGDYLVDDNLDSAAEDIICGVYHVLAEGMQSSFNIRVIIELGLGSKGQATELSWWPKASAWENSGLDVGYWSQDCENFYQRRLAEIRNGTAVLLPARKWREKIRFKSFQTGQFRNHMDQLSDMFLCHDVGYWQGQA
jgi:hypothetical protein